MVEGVCLVFGFVVVNEKNNIVTLEMHSCSCCKWEKTWCCCYEDVKDEDEHDNAPSSA